MIGARFSLKNIWKYLLERQRDRHRDVEVSAPTHLFILGRFSFKNIWKCWLVAWLIQEGREAEIEVQKRQSSYPLVLSPHAHSSWSQVKVGFREPNLILSCGWHRPECFIHHLPSQRMHMSRNLKSVVKPEPAHSECNVEIAGSISSTSLNIYTYSFAPILEARFWPDL